MPTPFVQAQSASGNRRKAQEQEMAPANLSLLRQPFAHHLIDRRLD
jgi:hypothetical protein